MHRLDKETSGVCLLARTAEVHRALNSQFDRHSVEKIYPTLVAGKPTWEAKSIDLPLRVNGDRRHRTVVDFERGKAGITLCKRLEVFEGCSLLSIQPTSGRTHPIRAHLAHLGHPILGDRLYGVSVCASSVPLSVERLALHAYAISIEHPQNGKRLGWKAAYPLDFHSWLEQLRKSAAKKALIEPARG